MKSLFARVAVLALLSSAAALVPSAASAHEGCETAEDVPVVIEFGSLDGEDTIVCAQHGAGKTGFEAINDTGVELEESSGAMPMVCRIDGQPTPEQEKCGNALNGPGYWAFMVAKEGKDWGYASVGLQEYELAEGDFVALVYHLLADGETVPVKASADAQTRADAVVPAADDASAETSSDQSEDDSSSGVATTALPIAIGAAFLVAIAAFVVARRRRS